MTSRITKKIAAFTTFMITFGMASVAFAQGEASAKDMAIAGNAGLIAFAAGLAIGLAALGATLAQGRTAASALDGMARNPGAAAAVRSTLILSLALIESIVILSIVGAVLILGKF